MTDLPVLWHLRVSNYNEKARWALDHKGIAHVRRAALPGSQTEVAQRLGAGSTLPVLVLGGKVIGDSTDIVAALEEYRPAPPLYPRDPQARAHALELEEFFDEELGPYVRRAVVHALLGDAELFLDTFAPDLPADVRKTALAGFRDFRVSFAERMGADARGVEDAYEKIAVAGERFRCERGPEGYLVGDVFTVADLTLAALVAPAVAPEQFPYPQPQRDHPLLARLTEALAESGIRGWVLRMYERHRGRSSAVAEETALSLAEG
jgi:glutathione S-transferase